MQKYWPIRFELAMINGIAMRNKRIINTFYIVGANVTEITQQPYGHWKKKLLAIELVYWVNMNADIRNIIKLCATWLEYQQTQPQEGNIIWGTMKAMGDGWYWYLFCENKNTSVHCRLLQLVSFCKKSWQSHSWWPGEGSPDCFTVFDSPRKLFQM